MGLDKWLKPEETKKETKRKNTTKLKKKSENNKENRVLVPEKTTSKLVKFTLTCPNSKCKYQKTIMKNILTDLDKTCPRCKKEMKIK